jgi:hypothetical protein
MSWVATAVVGGAIIGGVASNSAAKKSAEAQKQSTQMSIDAQKDATKLDSRIDPLIYGDSGIVNRINGLLDVPQNANTNSFNQGMNNYMGAGAAGAEGAFMGSQQAAQKLQGSSLAAPQMQAATAGSSTMNTALLRDPSKIDAAMLGNAANMTGSTVSAPSQNSLDLSPAYKDMIYGEAGNNPYLTVAIQKGINQSQNAFGNMVQDGTQAVQDALASIRGGAVSSGQYGGSRQGLAESRSISEFGKNLSRAASQYGQNNTDSAIAAQAGAYDADRNRALSAMSGLGAQQYGVAQQNAQLAQQAAAANMGANNAFAMQNNANQQSTNSANANAQNQFALQNNANLQNTNQFNASAANQNSMFNAGNQQQANAANMNAQQQTNQLNSQNQVTGIGLSSGLLGQAYGYNQNANNQELNRVGTVSGLLQPYAGKGSPISVPNQAPVYNNAVGSAIGGATAGLGLYNAFNTPSSTTNFTAANGYQNYGGTNPTMNYATAPSISPFGTI